MKYFVVLVFCMGILAGVYIDIFMVRYVIVPFFRQEIIIKDYMAPESPYSPEKVKPV